MNGSFILKGFRRNEFLNLETSYPTEINIVLSAGILATTRIYINYDTVSKTMQNFGQSSTISKNAYPQSLLR